MSFAPTARGAEVLHWEANLEAETVAKLIHDLDHPGPDSIAAGLPSGTTLIRANTASGPLSCQPTWSPEGTSIIFTQVDGPTWPGWSIATMEADGTNLRSATGSISIVGSHARLRPEP